MKFRILRMLFLVAIIFLIIRESEPAKKKNKKAKKLKGRRKGYQADIIPIKPVYAGDLCTPGETPDENGVWVPTEKVKKICPKDTTCISRACNCDDIGGYTYSLSYIPDGGLCGMRDCRECKRVAGQKCSSNNDCFHEHSCVKGMCTCPPGLKPCINYKRWVVYGE